MPLPSPAVPRRHPARLRARRARAFTLVELVLAAALAAMLLLGLQSAVLIASKAIPPATETADAAAQGAALDRIALDLSYAKSISKYDSAGLIFIVADRTGDALDDTIAYTWAGAKTPLLREFNGGAPETILADVNVFSLDLKTEVVTGATTYIESSETLLGSYSSATSLNDWIIDTTTWVAQYIPLTLPGGTVDYRTTRIRLRLEKSSSADGTTSFELRGFRSGQPTTRTLGSASVSEASLPTSMSSYTLLLPSLRYIDPTEQVGLVIRPTVNPATCELSYRTTGAPASSGAWCTSATGGGTWTATAGRALIYELYGVYRTLDSTPDITRGTFLLITVKAGTNADLELNLPLPNHPEIVP